MKVKVDGLDKALKDIEKWSKEKRVAVEDEVAKSALRVERAAKNNVVSDQSRLRTSIGQESRGLEREVFAGASYAPYVEFGTKKKVDVPAGLESYAKQFQGKSGTRDDLLRNITMWAGRNGIPKEDIPGIVMKIAIFGVSARPFMFPAAEEEEPKFAKGVGSALKK